MDEDGQQDKNKRDELLKFLALQYERVGSHGEKIWEEMKHFSWALYLLLSAPFVLKHWETPELKYGIWLLIFPFLAILVAIIATLSICKESKDFLDALGTALSIEKRLEFHKENPSETPKMLVSKHRKEMLRERRKSRYFEVFQPDLKFQYGRAFRFTELNFSHCFNFCTFPTVSLKIDGATDETIDSFINRKQSILCKVGSIPNRFWFVFYFIVLIIFGIVEVLYIATYWYN